MDYPDVDLINRCLKGDNTAFDILVRKYQRRVHAFCYHMVGDHEEAADVTQEVFIKAYYALERFRGDASFTAWVLGIAHNACIDSLRKHSKRRAESLEGTVEAHGEFQSNQPSPEYTMMHKEISRLVSQAVLKLPEKPRAVITMFYVNGVAIKDIATALGRPEGSIKSDLHYAREALRRKLDGVVVEK